MLNLILCLCGFCWLSKLKIAKNCTQTNVMIHTMSERMRTRSCITSKPRPLLRFNRIGFCTMIDWADIVASDMLIQNFLSSAKYTHTLQWWELRKSGKEYGEEDEEGKKINRKITKRSGRLKKRNNGSYFSISKATTHQTHVLWLFFLYLQTWNSKIIPVHNDGLV